MINNELEIIVCLLCMIGCLIAIIAMAFVKQPDLTDPSKMTEEQIKKLIDRNGD